MPLTLPHAGVATAPNSPLICVTKRHIEVKRISGGARLDRRLHYLQKVEDGLCYFGGTKENSLSKEGLLLVVTIGDLSFPDDFKRRVINLYRDGWLTAHDTWHFYYETDEVPQL